ATAPDGLTREAAARYAKAVRADRALHGEGAVHRRADRALHQERDRSAERPISVAAAGAALSRARRRSEEARRRFRAASLRPWRLLASEGGARRRLQARRPLRRRRQGL